MDEIKTMLEKIGSIGDNINVDAVFGKPQTVEGRVLIPVAEIAYGFGAGFGVGSPECGCEEECCCQAEAAEEDACCCHAEAAEEGACCAEAEEHACCEVEAGAEEGSAAVGGGGGAGGKARPIAYIEVGPDGTRVTPIMDEQKIAFAGMLLGAWTVGWVAVVLKTLFQALSPKN